MVMTAQRYTLGADGYFRRDGARFIPAGANWWPGSCGVELWERWPEDEIRRDLDLLRAHGFNCLRFFLRWQDFEREPGIHDRRNLDRLDRLLGWFAERDLAAHPSLFVGFMSGGVFWPAWKAGRNLFSDPFMRERSTAFARAAAAVIARHRDCVIAIDQGNEMCCLQDSHQAPPAAVSAWCEAVNRAIRAEWPEALLISGNEQNQINCDNGWRLDAQPGCDLLSMHTYPVPAWNVVPFDGMTDPLAQSLLPFYTRVARAFRPVWVQEFGTIVTYGRRQQDAYLRAILPACWEAGGNGFLWWCLRDIASGSIHPYVKHGFEGTLGLLDAEGRVKPGLEFFPEFCRGLPQRPAPTPAARPVGLYWPRHWWNRDEPGNNGNDPWQSSRRLTIANHLLRTAGREVDLVRGDLPAIPASGLAALLVAGVNLRVDEVEALAAWVAAGGRLVWHGPDPVNWGGAYTGLIGAVPLDYRAPGARRGEFAGEAWEFASFPRGMRCEIEERGAEVLMRDQDGNPLLLRHRLGRGTVVTALPVPEEAPAGCAADRTRRDRWAGWYRAVLAAAGA